MNKKFINGLLLATLMVGSAGSFTSCKDYDDDIDNLQNQIDKISVTLGEIQEKVKNGSIISSVTSTTDGLKLVIDGKEYVITNGKPGENGAPGTSWSIGTDGYWYKDGVKTDYKAVPDAGAAGSQGPAGPAGPAGPQGPAGKYYVPNEDGYFWIHEEGKDPVKTDISWVAAGPTAAFTGTELILSNLKDADGKTLDPVKIQLGNNVTSIAFIPDEYLNGLPVKSFYTLQNLAIDLTKAGADGTYAKSQWGIAASNVVNFSYRLNPEKAFVAPTATGSFIARDVKVSVSRAAGDKAGLLSCGALDSSNEGVIVAPASLNYAAYADIDNEALVALCLVNGQNSYVSDYVMINQADINAGLVDRIASSNDKGAYNKGNAPVTKGIYNITRPQASGEKWTAYINTMLGANPAVLTEKLPYNGTLDLSKAIALLANKTETGWNGINYLDVLGFAPEYTFSLPSEYILSASGSNNENQQNFVKLDGSVLSVNTATGESGTQAIGRTPVVRVDARVDGNVIATAFVLIEVVRPSADKNKLEIDLGTYNVNYSAVAAPFSVGQNKTNELAGQLTTAEINSKVYSALGLSPEQFAEKYTSFEVKAALKVVKRANGKADNYTQTVTTIDPIAATTGDGTFSNIPGIYVNGGLATTGVTTNYPVQIWINNKIHTQEWGDIDATYTTKGLASAQYVITITYKAANGDTVVLTQNINVTEDHKGLKFNPNYYANGMVQSYGSLNGSTYKMIFNMGNAFEMLNGKTIFELTAGQSITNVTAVNLKMTSCDKDSKGNALVAYNNSTHVLSAVPALMTAATLNANFEYTVTLANTETCGTKQTFTTQLINPVKAGRIANAIALDANVTGDQSTSVVPGVLVQNLQSANVIEWRPEVKDKDGNVTQQAGLYLTDKATSFGYTAGKLANPATGEVVITYAPDNSAAYKDFVNNLDGAFNVDPSTGAVTYSNKAVLVRDVNFNINATVTLSNFSKITVAIPFTIKK
ncbi:MAG: hypothetical protein J6A20_00620 [Muribaculaceae bacterium]|nr:hypothetical protein [Muribaculaceae bacterium]